MEFSLYNEDGIYRTLHHLPLENDDDVAVIIGVGGVGYWLALMVAVSRKYSHLALIDPDNWQMRNMARCPVPAEFLGVSKVESVASVCAVLNPRLNIWHFRESFTLELLQTITADVLGRRVDFFVCVDSLASSRSIVRNIYSALAREAVSYTVHAVHTDGAAHVTGYSAVPKLFSDDLLVNAAGYDVEDPNPAVCASAAALALLSVRDIALGVNGFDIRQDR